VKLIEKMDDEQMHSILSSDFECFINRVVARGADASIVDADFQRIGT
jgi:hypothetical protein